MAIAVSLLAAIWLRTLWHGLVALRTFTIASTTVAAIGAGTLGLRRSRFLPGERRAAWALLGLGCLSWGIGNLVWGYEELWRQRSVPFAQRAVPFPSWADAGYVLLIPFVAAALLVLIIGSTQAAARLRTLLDGLLITSALLFASWILFLGRLVEYARNGQGLFAGMLGLAYPVGDVFLVGLLLLIASRSVAPVRRTLAFVGLALVAFLVADVGFWYYLATSKTLVAPWTDPGWLVGFLLIGYAALRPIPVFPEATSLKPGLVLGALPLVPFFVSTGLAMMVEVREGSLPPFLFWNAIVVVGVLAIRQFVMVYENLQLRRGTEHALERQQESDLLRSNLLHTITHDIQNPLTPIKLQLALLREHGKLGEGEQRRLVIVERNVDQVVRLSADLADVSKLHDGRLTLVRQTMDLRAVLVDVVESFQPLARQRGIDLRLEDGPPLPLDGDTLRLRQVVANLVSNACKFTPTGGTVTVAGRRNGDDIVVQVTDSGRGLDAEEVGQLFRAFGQVDPAAKAWERGTGLGLFISRGLVEAHGGRIAASSPGRGKGATFTVHLPAVGPDGQPPVSGHSPRRDMATGAAVGPPPSMQGASPPGDAQVVRPSPPEP